MTSKPQYKQPPEKRKQDNGERAKIILRKRNKKVRKKQKKRRLNIHIQEENLTKQINKQKQIPRIKRGGQGEQNLQRQGLNP